MRIKSFDVLDVRFPTSLVNAGTDAVHKDPDYSAAYVILKTDGDHEGHGFAFTIGRGNEVVRCGDPCAGAARRGKTIGRDIAGPAAFWEALANDTQLRWLGPEKGVIHLALAAIVNAVWDLQAKAAAKPVWKLLADMSSREIVECIDFRYITDALSPEEAIEMLERQRESPRGPRSDPSARRLSGLHDVGGLVRLFGRGSPAAVQGGAGRRMAALQGQSRWRAGRRRPASRARPRDHRTRLQADDRRQSALGRERSDRPRPGALAAQPVVDRGADESGRRAGARGDCQGSRARLA